MAIEPVPSPAQEREATRKRAEELAYQALQSDDPNLSGEMDEVMRAIKRTGIPVRDIGPNAYAVSQLLAGEGEPDQPLRDLLNDTPAVRERKNGKAREKRAVPEPKQEQITEPVILPQSTGSGKEDLDRPLPEWITTNCPKCGATSKTPLSGRIGTRDDTGAWMAEVMQGHICPNCGEDTIGSVSLAYVREMQDLRDAANPKS